MSRDLILTTAIGYGWGELQPFFGSLRRSGCEAEVVVATTGLDSATEAEAARHGAKLLRVRGALRRLPRRLAQIRFSYRLAGWRRRYPRIIAGLPLPAASRQALREWAGGWFHGVMCSRFLWYGRFLRRHGNAYDRILISDVRDVIFQADPFGSWGANRLAAFLEDNAVIGEEPLNTHWIRTAFGEEALERLRGLPVSCAGVTLGPTSAVREYLEVMAELLTREGWKFAGEELFDQGVHNYALRAVLRDRVALHRNFHGKVLTMQLLRPGEVRADGEGIVRNRDGTVIPILHQYDRHPELAASLRRRLAGEPTAVAAGNNP